MKRACVSLLFVVLIGSPAVYGSPNTCSYKTPKLKVVQGILIDILNSPVKNATVRLWSDGFRTKLISETKADELGRFRLPSVAPGSYYLEYQAPGYHDSQMQVRVSKFSSKNVGLVITPPLGSMGCEDRIARRELKPNERLSGKPTG